MPKFTVKTPEEILAAIKSFLVNAGAHDGESLFENVDDPSELLELVEAIADEHQLWADEPEPDEDC